MYTPQNQLQPIQQPQAQQTQPQFAQQYYNTSQAPNFATDENNILVTMAMPLLTLITQIRHTVDNHNVPNFRAQVIEELKNFENKLTNIHYPMRTIVAARYCLCTSLDEAVLSRPWGTKSIWVQESLLSLFHKETWGGERLYIILDDMLKDTKKNIDFIELVYFLLSLGFEGKFYGDEQMATREEIRNRLFYRIRNTRQKPDKVLSLHWRDQAPQILHEKRTKLKKLGLSTTVAIVLIMAFFNYKVYKVANPALDELSNIARVSPVTVFSQLINRGRSE